jgi:hypothetical protein
MGKGRCAGGFRGLSASSHTISSPFILYNNLLKGRKKYNKKGPYGEATEKVPKGRTSL